MSPSPSSPPSPPRLTLFELSFYPSAPLFSPNVWLARLCLLHKRVAFDVIEQGLLDRSPTSLFALSGGQERPLFPTLRVEHTDGRPTEWIRDSWRIALFLDATFPTYPLLQAGQERVDMTHPSWHSAVSQSSILKSGYGSSDSMWNLLFHLVAPQLEAMARRAGEEVHSYFISDQRHGKGGWEKVVALQSDLRGMVAQCRRSLLPFDEALSVDVVGSHAGGGGEAPRFLSSTTTAGLVDYIVLSRWAMVQAVEGELGDALLAADSGKARTWLAAKGQAVEEEEGEWWGDVRLD